MAYSRRVALDVRGIHSDGIDTSSVDDITFSFLVAATAWCVLNEKPTCGFLIMESALSNWQIESKGEGRVAAV